jgi:hypothetical protein
MKRTDLMDVSPEVHSYEVERLRNMTCEEKWQIMFWHIQLGRLIHEAALKRIEEERSA